MKPADSEDPVKVYCKFIHETSKAVLIKVLYKDEFDKTVPTEEGEEVWIPRSQVLRIEDDFEFPNSVLGYITIMGWFAKKSGITNK